MCGAARHLSSRFRKTFLLLADEDVVRVLPALATQSATISPFLSGSAEDKFVQRSSTSKECTSLPHATSVGKRPAHVSNRTDHRQRQEIDTDQHIAPYQTAWS